MPFVYTFTELSVSLLARARKVTFKNIAKMEFLKLNIEEDPPEELLGKYHIIVSSNCVHATRDLRRSLGNIHKLVRPGEGCVALVELTQKLPWYELVWGLLDGWWLFDDGRDYALQSPWAWERAMRDSGFAHVDWSEGPSRESRSVRVICGMDAEPKASCPAKATSILLKPSSSRSAGRTLFLCPDGFGSGAVFTSLQPSLARTTDLSICALNSPFLRSKPDMTHPPTIEELAASYVAEIKCRQRDGPFSVGGYSVGGVIAYEAARQLLEDGDDVAKLVLIDTACPTFATHMPSALVDYLNQIQRFGMFDEDEIRANTRGRPIAGDHFTLARQQLEQYKARKLPRAAIGKVILVSAREGVSKPDNEVPRPRVLPDEQKIVDWFLEDRIDDGPLGWHDLIGGKPVQVVRASGTHFSMMTSPMVKSPNLHVLTTTLLIGQNRSMNGLQSCLRF